MMNSIIIAVVAALIIVLLLVVLLLFAKAKLTTSGEVTIDINDGERIGNRKGLSRLYAHEFKHLFRK